MWNPGGGNRGNRGRQRRRNRNRNRSGNRGGGASNSNSESDTGQSNRRRRGRRGRGNRNRRQAPTRHINMPPPRRHLTSYATRIRDRWRFYDKVRDQLRRRLRTKKLAIETGTIEHIWTRHGCYQNAKRESGLPKNRGKMPSYFRNHRTMVWTIAATILRPNWIRTAMPPPRRGGAWLFQRKHLGIPVHKKPPIGGSNQHQQQRARRFYFKRFKQRIGYSGRGYGYRGANAATEDEECFYCAVLLEGDHRLITAFPMLGPDADRHGTGPKSHVSNDLDQSSFDSRSSISSSESFEDIDGEAEAKKKEKTKGPDKSNSEDDDEGDDTKTAMDID